MRKKQVNQPCCSECGGGILSDIFIKPFVPKKKTKIEKLPMEVGLYSEMCMESYNKVKSKMIIGEFTKVPNFSQENCIVYVSNDTVVLAIRGTDPKNSKDIFTDIALALNKLKITPRYREINNIFKKVTEKYQYIGKSLIPYKFIATGHSLGGSLALQLLLDNPNKIDAIHIFNAGGAPADIQKGLVMKIAKFLGVKYYKTISKKIHIYRVTGDLISFTNRFLDGNYYDIQSNSFDRHGMSNFKPTSNDISITPKPDYKTIPDVTIPEINTEAPPREITIKPSLRAEIEQPLGEGIKNKNNFLSSDKMDTIKLEKMTVNQMLCHIRSNRKIKNNLSGYSKMNKAQLIEALKKFHEDGEKHPRIVKETEWSKALKVFNEGRNTFVIPKKDSKDYEEVQKIISNGGKRVEAVQTEKPKPKKLKKTKPQVVETEPKQKRSKVIPDQKAIVDEDVQSQRRASLRRNPKRKIIFAEDDE
jgi:hypothetical protein